jgi:hypothetical protein
MIDQRQKLRNATHFVTLFKIVEFVSLFYYDTAKNGEDGEQMSRKYKFVFVIFS